MDPFIQREVTMNEMTLPTAEKQPTIGSYEALFVIRADDRRPGVEYLHICLVKPGCRQSLFDRVISPRPHLVPGEGCEYSGFEWTMSPMPDACSLRMCGPRLLAKIRGDQPDRVCENLDDATKTFLQDIADRVARGDEVVTKTRPMVCGTKKDGTALIANSHS